MLAYLALLVLVFGMFNKHCVDDGQMGQLKHKMDPLNIIKKYVFT